MKCSYKVASLTTQTLKGHEPQMRFSLSYFNMKINIDLSQRRFDTFMSHSL